MMFDVFQAYIFHRIGLSSVATKDHSVPCNRHITSDASVPYFSGETDPFSPPTFRDRSQCFGTLEVIQELDEHIDEIENLAHTEETSRQLDTPIDGSAIPVSHMQLKEVGDVDNSSRPTAHHTEGYYSTLRDSPTIRLVADTSVQLAPPSAPITSPLPVATHVAPRSSTTSLEAFSRKPEPSTTSEPQTTTIYLPRPNGPSVFWDDMLYSFQVHGL